jgi:hypothetical protein
MKDQVRWLLLFIVDRRAVEETWMGLVVRGPLNPDELYCEMFEDTDFGPRLESGDTVFDTEVDSHLRLLEALLMEAGSDPVELLGSPLWCKIEGKALDILEMV